MVSMWGEQRKRSRPAWKCIAPRSTSFLLVHASGSRDCTLYATLLCLHSAEKTKSSAAATGRSTSKISSNRPRCRAAGIRCESAGPQQVMVMSASRMTKNGQHLSRKRRSMPSSDRIRAPSA